MYGSARWVFNHMSSEGQINTSGESAASYVSTPYGILTAAGNWYHVQEEDLRDYAENVLDHVSLERVLIWADRWVDSPRTVTLWMLPVFLWLLSPVWAAVSALILYGVWALVSPALPTIGGARFAAVLRPVLAQGGYYVVVLSALAAAERFTAVGIGLIAFILFRWGVMAWLARALFRPAWRRLYPLPVADQVLRGLIVRAALKYRVSVPQVDALTSDILETWVASSEEGNETDE